MENNSNQEVFAMPRIGENAPSFKAVTTQGPINFPADYKDSWVILFSHPADFTPVCTSEFMTFASMESQFNCFYSVERYASANAISKFFAALDEGNAEKFCSYAAT